ncbi:PucR family transcriptional regulator [Skermania sp. ID1734]|uniref:PucR family transcriptional regulator n=1 Tax=Skermania sp. ID1734 TaxID=2597516 RepID=UPI00117EE7C5|nr:helix-turn-helix domain-containing protein [Skermania sp. ID1734]TSD96585.1 PucR family transcriptional regulator [Skermania sp. ID1734]
MTGQSDVPEVARRLFARRGPFIEELFTEIRSEIKALDYDEPTVLLLQATVAENVVAAAKFLERNTPIADLEAPKPAVVHARALAQRDIPLSALVRAYRIGHARFLDTAMRYALELGRADSAETLIGLVGRCGDYIDKVAEQVGLAYERERDRWMSNRGGFRQKWIALILDGSVTDVREAEDALRYRLDGLHVAVEVWPEADVPTREAMSVFDEVALVLGRYLHSIDHPLMVPTGERQARIWFRMPAPADIDGNEVAAALTNKSVRAHVALGGPEHGIEGFRRTQIQAARVQTLAAQSGARLPRATTYSDVTALALMAHDLEALRRFVDKVLGSLAVDDSRHQWLRETLLVFLANNRSYSASAQQLHLHRNTIQYRIQQALEGCNIDIDDGAAVLDLQIALNAAHLLQSSVLRKPAELAAMVTYSRRRA